MRIFTLVFLAMLFGTIAICQDPEMPTEEELFDLDIEFLNTHRASQAVITSVEARGSENNYSFAVKIESPDTGCKQYADWWEVFDQEGNLLYRRIFRNSHVDEQPFSSTGGPIKIDKKTFVFIRAHMNTFGYSSYTFSGTVEKGFKEELLRLDFFSELEETLPLPKNCEY